MKFLTDRKKIAEAINIQKLPVLTIDISKSMEGFDHCYEGSKVRVLGGHSKGYEDLDTRCTVRMFGDEKENSRHDAPQFYGKIILSGGAVFLSSDFGLRDVDEMVEWSNAREVRAGDQVIVYFRGNGVGYLRLMKVGSRIDPHCSTVAVLEDV